MLHEGDSEIRKNMGDKVSHVINKMLAAQGVTIIENAKITQIEGDYKIEKLHFRK